jgi:hypothetical protein
MGSSRRRNGYISCIHRTPVKEICTEHHVDPMGPTPGHVAMCWHKGCHVSMTHHQSKRSTSRRIQHNHVFSKDSRAHNPNKPPSTNPYTGNRLGDPTGSHLDERQRDRSRPGIGQPHRSADPTLRPFAPIFHVLSPHWILRACSWCLECYCV